MPAAFGPQASIDWLTKGVSMPADKRFMERIERIRRGKTWVPDGVIQEPLCHASRRTRGGGGAGLSILMILAVPVALVLAGPDTLPEPLQGFFTAPTTEAAMASLGEWELLSQLAR
jgi:hypothetical protein